MIYVISDLHGHYDKYQKLLQKIKFSTNDTLYILGDMIDRGPDGFKIMLDITKHPNIIALLGNHEAMAIKALPHILEIIQKDENLTLIKRRHRAVALWFYNGGKTSLTDFLNLDGEQQQIVWKYMINLPLYKEIKVGERQFVLVHGGLEHFSPKRPLKDYKPDEILWCRPNANTTYYKNKYVIFGHTPVQLLDFNEQDIYDLGKIYRKGNLIDIDCGCMFSNGRLGCLCLDTMKEIYV